MNILRTEQVLPLPHVELSPPGKHRLSPATSESRFFQEQSTIPDRSGYYREVVGYVMRQYSFSDRTLLKLMKQKETKQNKKKAHRAFFPAHICKLAAL